MKSMNFEDTHSSYPVDIDEYRAAALEGATEHHFTLDGQEVTVHGSNK